MEYYQRSTELGEGYGFLSIGDMYRKGLGVEQSYEKAAENFRKSAEFGVEEAAEALKELVEAGYVSEDYLNGLGE